MASSTQPYGKLLDYEQYIDHQLGRTRARIKMTDVLTACLILLAAAIGGLFLEVVLDHVIGLPLWFRRIVLISGLAGAGAFMAIRIGLPLARRVNAFYAARTIEESDPYFNNSLINYLDLKRNRDLISKAALAAIEASAVEHLTKVEVDSVVNQRRMIHVAYALSGVVVLFCLYAALTPKSIFDSARRALLADVVRPTNTRLLHIKPGDDSTLNRVVAGTHVPFTVDVQGTRPAKVALHFSVDGGKFFTVKEFSAGKNYFDPWEVVLPNVQQSMDYYLTGGDAESLRYHLEVLPAPTVTAVMLDYAFPPYTGIAPRANVEGGNVEAIEGTRVTVHAKTNEPARAGSINFAKRDPIPMEVLPNNPRELSGTFVVEQTGTYTIKFRTTGGQMNPDPVVYDIMALPDHPPTAKFTQPDVPRFKTASNVKVPLRMEANDDFGVKDATLHVRQGSESLISENLLEQKPSTREFRSTKMLDLAAMKIKPGSSLEYWLTVRDTKEPQSNRFETVHQVVDVGDPLPEPDRRKVEETNAKQQAEEPQPPREDTAQANNPDEAPPPNEPRPGPEREQPDANPRDPNSAAPPRAKDQGANDRPDIGDQEKPMSPEDQKKLNDIQRAMEKMAGNQRQNNPQARPQKNASNDSLSNPNGGNPDATRNPNNNANRPNKPAEPAAPNNRNPRPQANDTTGVNPQNPPSNGNMTPNAPAPDVAQGNRPPNPTAPDQPQQARHQQNQGAKDPNAPNQQNQGAKDPNAPNQQNQGAKDPNAPNQQNQGAKDPNAPNQQNQGAKDSNAPNQQNQGAKDSNAPNQQNQGAKDPNAPNQQNQGAKDPNAPNQQNQGAKDPNAPNQQNQGANQGAKDPNAPNQQNQADNSTKRTNSKNQTDLSKSERISEKDQANTPDRMQERTNNDAPKDQTKPKPGQPKPEDTQNARPASREEEKNANPPPDQPSPTRQNAENKAQTKQAQQDNAEGAREASKDSANPKPDSKNAPARPTPSKKETDAKTKSATEKAKPKEEKTEGKKHDTTPKKEEPKEKTEGRHHDTTPKKDEPKKKDERKPQAVPDQPPPQQSAPQPPMPQPQPSQSSNPAGGSSHAGSTPKGSQPGQGGTQPQPGAGSQPGQTPSSGSSPGHPGQGTQPGPGQGTGPHPGQGGGKGENSEQGESKGEGQSQGPGPGQQSGPGNSPSGSTPDGKGTLRSNQPGQGSPNGTPGQGNPGGQKSQTGPNRPAAEHPQAKGSEKGAHPAEGDHAGQSSPNEPSGKDGTGDGRQESSNTGKSDKPGQPGNQPGTENSPDSSPAQPGAKDGLPGGSGSQQPNENSEGGTRGGGSSSGGGGGSKPGNPNAGTTPYQDDQAKPSPKAKTPDLNSGETVAPDAPPSNLVLRKLQDLLKNNEVTPQLEKETGLSREQMEQFVKKFEKAPKAEPGPGREIELKSKAKDRTFDPNRKLPDLNPNANIGTKAIRDRGEFAQDQIRDNVEGARFDAPPELRSKFEGYKSTISRKNAPGR